MSDNNTTSCCGIGFLGALTILFITLKLCSVGIVAHWSWFWVLSPTLIPVFIVIGILVFVLLIWIVAKILAHYSD